MAQGNPDLKYICPFNVATMKKAAKELGEKAETRILEVQNLRTRLEKVPGLKARTDIHFLLRFLRARKFDQERAYESVKTYYAMRRDHPEIFDDLKPSRVKHLIDVNYFEVLKNRDNDGCVVVCMRSVRWDDKRYPIVDVLKTMAIMLMKIIEDEETQVHGMHLLIDLSGSPLTQFARWTPSIVKNATEIMMSMIPIRVKRFDYVNMPGYFQALFAIVKSFLKEKMIQRLHVNDETFSKLHSTIDLKYIPTEYGGSLKTDSCKEWGEELLKCDKDFEEDNKYGYVSLALENERKESAKEDANLGGIGAEVVDGSYPSYWALECY